jgi:CBS domain-containing protein
MDLTAKISTIMSTDLKTATPEDAVGHINQIFQEYRINHVPVINGENIKLSGFHVG